MSVLGLFESGHKSVLYPKRRMPTARTLLLVVFCFEFVQILLVCLVSIRLLVLGEFGVILLFHLLGLSLAGLFVCKIQALPALTDELRNFCKRQVLAFKSFSHFYKTSVLISRKQIPDQTDG